MLRLALLVTVLALGGCARQVEALRVSTPCAPSLVSVALPL